MKKISLKNVKDALSRKEMRVIAGGYALQAWKCCNGGHCGDCVSSSGMPTCSSGWTLTAC